MNERIKLIRKNSGLSQESFGERIKVTRGSISKIESGINNPSDQTIKLICSEFCVNEDWLRTGAGGEDNMYIPDDMIFLQNAGRLAQEQNEFKKFYINMLLELPDEYWDYVYNEFKKFEKGKEKG